MSTEEDTENETNFFDSAEMSPGAQRLFNVYRRELGRR